MIPDLMVGFSFNEETGACLSVEVIGVLLTGLLY